MHITARTPIAAFALATVIQASGTAVAMAETQAAVEKITPAAAGIVRCAGQTQAACERTIRAKGVISLLATAESIGEGTNHTYVDPTRLVGRAWVRGQWEIAAYSQLEASCSIRQLRPIEKISPAQGVCVTDVSSSGDAAKKVMAEAVTEATALPFGETDTYYEGSRRVADASAQMVISTAAVVNTVAFTHAVDLIYVRAKVDGDGQAIRQAKGSSVISTSATGWVEHWFPIRGVAVLEAIATGTAQLIQRITKAPMVVFSAVAEATGREARIGTTARRVDARAMVVGTPEKIRFGAAELAAEANVAAMGVANFAGEAQADVSSELVAGVAVNMGKPAPPSRTMRVYRDKRVMVVERSPRLMQVT